MLNYKFSHSAFQILMNANNQQSANVSKTVKMSQVLSNAIVTKDIYCTQTKEAAQVS